VEQLVAVDVHVHAWAPGAGGDPMVQQATRYFGNVDVPDTLDGMAAYYRERKMAAVVFSVDVKGEEGVHVSNDDVLAFAARNDDVIIPFVSVDPMRGAAAVAEAERLIATGKVRGFKLHPQIQAFAANDPAIYPLYEVIEAARLPVIVHTGHSGMGTGMRGGGGIRLKYGNPMFLDDVAVDFPDMPIVLAHPSFPWQDEALSMCLHKPNVYIDLSGWSPKYFPANLVHYANTQLKHKVLFGSDYPLLTPDRWLRDFAALSMKDEVRPMILRDNAVRLLGLSA
jgi:predicted TIM-barrel fold metal-dependent hydrolase